MSDPSSIVDIYYNSGDVICNIDATLFEISEGTPLYKNVIIMTHDIMISLTCTGNVFFLYFDQSTFRHLWERRDIFYTYIHT